MAFQMAPLDPPEKSDRDLLLELRTRLLHCAVTETSARGPARSPQAKRRRSSSAGNLSFCATWVSKWEKALAGTPRFPIPNGTRAKARTELQAKALTLEVISFDPKLPGARACRDQFVRLFKGEATTEQVVSAVAGERLQLGDARDDMHAYFSNLANRVGLGDRQGTPYDESLFAFVMGTEGVVTTTQVPEPDLYARLHSAMAIGPPGGVEEWIDAHFSQEAERRRRREDLAELGDRYPHRPNLVEHALAPEHHDWAAVYHAIQRFIDAGVPLKRKMAFRREWASTFLWLAELATNPDREWRGRGYGEGEIPRSWIWSWIESEPEKRARFNGLLACALGVLDSIRLEQAGLDVEVVASDARGLSDQPVPAVEGVVGDEPRQVATTADEHPQTSINPDPRASARLLGDGVWRGLKPEGPLLRGWHAILTALGAKTDRNAQVAMRRRNESLGGPIRYVRNKPEAFPNQLHAWIQSAEESARVAAEKQMVEVGTKRELEERGGARLPDLKLQPKPRRTDATNPELRKRAPDQ